MIRIATGQKIGEGFDCPRLDTLMLATPEHFAVIDRKLVWHGGMNLLGKEDVWDNLIRVENHQAADLICTLQLTELKLQNHRLSKSDMLFFRDERTLKKNYLKPMRGKKIGDDKDKR